MKHLKIYTAIFLFAFVLSACAGAPEPTPAATPEPLTGEVSRAVVMSAAGWTELDPASYQPQAEALETIRAQAEDLEVLLFLGTWCGDSKREVPHFFQLMDEAGISAEQLRMIALDRSKQDAEGLTAEWGIEYVPTFIFLQDGVEIGRIVERPAETLEADLAGFLAGPSDEG